MPNKVNHSFNALLKVHSIKSRSFSLIRLCGKVVYRVEKSYVDKLVARKRVQVGKDQEKAQSERDSHSENRGGKKPN